MTTDNFLNRTTAVGFNPGAIVYPYGSPQRLGIIRDVRDVPMHQGHYLVQWMKPRKGHDNPEWVSHVCLLDQLQKEAERKANTHKRNLAKAREFFGVADEA